MTTGAVFCVSLLCVDQIPFLQLRTDRSACAGERELVDLSGQRLLVKFVCDHRDLLLGFHKRHDNRRIEVRSAFPGDELICLVDRHCALVAALGYQRVKDICDSHNAGTQRDLLAREPRGIAAAVPPFVVIACHLYGNVQVARIAELLFCTQDELLSGNGMAFHDLEFVLREAALFMASRTKRNMATIGGNIAAMRDDSYLLPVLYAVHAGLEVLRSSGADSMPIDSYIEAEEAEKDMLITAVCVPKDIKVVSKRYANTAQSHAVLTMSAALTEDGMSLKGAVKNVGLLHFCDIEDKFRNDPETGEDEIIEMVRNGSNLQKQLGLLSDYEEKLTSTLKDDERKLFLAFANTVSEVQAESQLDSFMVGFRLGARFVFDTFIDDTAPYCNLTEDS